MLINVEFVAQKLTRPVLVSSKTVERRSHRDYSAPVTLFGLFFLSIKWMQSLGGEGQRWTETWKSETSLASFMFVKFLHFVIRPMSCRKTSIMSEYGTASVLDLVR